MDSETIRITISPIFLFCSISLTVGMFIGIFLGLSGLTYPVMAIVAITILGISFFYYYENVYLKRRKKTPEDSKELKLSKEWSFEK